MIYDHTIQDAAIFEAYATKKVAFRFRGIAFDFKLSHGLFSSADIDSGSRLLLKTISALMDEDLLSGAVLPASVLDAGCGVGVLGIAIVRAIMEAGSPEARCRAQDRDELARVFSARNAAANGLGAERLSACAERLLDGPQDARYGLIVSNLPAKAGAPVLADFYRRAGRLLAPGGRTATVIVEPLAEAARGWIADAGTPLLREERGREHTVFVTGAAERETAAPQTEPYLRASAEFEMEEFRYSLRALHGVADFSEPSRTVRLAAKLARRLPPPERLLVHESEQGHFPLFMAASAASAGAKIPRVLACGRNVLALQASKANLADAGFAADAAPAADLGLRAAGLRSAFGAFDMVASFPDIVPRVDRFAAAWEGAAALLESGGHFLTALSSTDAARFDRLKGPQFARVDDLKRDGFRALAYRRS